MELLSEQLFNDDNLWELILTFFSGKFSIIEDAEDAAVDFWIHLSNIDKDYLSNVINNGNFRAFVLTCASNFFNNNYRKQKRLQSKKEDYINFLAQNLLHEETETEKLQEKLSSCFKKLPKQHQDILRLRYFSAEKTSYEEIAEELKITVSTATGRLHRAKKRLRICVML